VHNRDGLRRAKKVSGRGHEDDAMAEQETFRGFFSYARHDAETDPGLIKALTTDLERRINAKLLGARFVIWRDQERLRTGER
jgi:hypothetical protein